MSYYDGPNTAFSPVTAQILIINKLRAAVECVQLYIHIGASTDAVTTTGGYPRNIRAGRWHVAITGMPHDPNWISPFAPIGGPVAFSDVDVVANFW